MTTKRAKTNETGDSDDLQALFDSIAAGDDGAAPAVPPPAAAPAPVAPPPAAVRPPAAPAAPPVAPLKASTGAATGSATGSTTGDDDDLQALFDSVSADAGFGGAQKGGADTTATTEAGAGEDAVSRETAAFNRIGKMTRKLHDSIKELGFDNALQKVAHSIPDARDRLTYVAQMTEQAASRVLNATDVARPVAEKIEADADGLGARWDKLYANQLTTDEFKVLAGETRGFLKSAADGSRTVNAQLLEIMMAQDFQDLTGQVIKKVVEMAKLLEMQLLEVLLEVAPEEVIQQEKDKVDSLLNGPVISSEGRDDVVTSQGQVDDLLESLGF
jgi:chemotaxis protein CheZ